MTYSDDCLKVIKILESKGRKPDSFSDAFPFIHHFRSTGGDASLKGFFTHCENHEIEGESNLNVYRRLQLIQQKVEEFESKNPEYAGISSIKYQVFGKQAVEEIPFK